VGDVTEFDELASHRRKLERKPCAVAEALAVLSSEDRAAVVTAMGASQETYNNSLISEWFRRRDMQVEWQAVRSHRTGICKCEPASD
jgi:hypothetical protein